MSFEVSLNGKSETVEDGLTVGRLLALKGVNPKRVVVELNREILPRDSFDSTALRAGDEMEVVTFVGGG